MKIKAYTMPNDLEEAYQLLQEEDAGIIAGGAWLKLLPKTLAPAIDLSGLKLDTINETEENYTIGSMVTLRQIETHGSLQTYMSGVLQEAISHIMGVPIRNIATIGGTVAGRYGFSDLLTPLLALKANLVFYKKGQMTLESFLKEPPKEKDILLEVIIKKEYGKANYTTVKKTANDFPILNVSVMKIGSHFRVAVGARPSVATLATKTMTYLNESKTLTEEVIEEAARIAVEEIKFGSNARGSKAYRAQLCKVLVERGIKEVAYENTN
ncbi:FAD binding domain-containing protein [Petrocella sp. FN5]|uniref:FAD binding domain-containing protein n=1 Tax=Petrocella sp. FN5 TaxID=3032002 RepID=UPI0023DA0BE0|nr:FAD binding domain-containing protein [Petrocella sp. FN5]MDF1616057.1 FAD binding domain-containing protein [Petrocella sp. FN5]